MVLNKSNSKNVSGYVNNVEALIPRIFEIKHQKQELITTFDVYIVNSCLQNS